MHSPDESLKPDCSNALRRKWPQGCPNATTKSLSSFRFENDNREITPISRNFQRNPGGLLYMSAWRSARDSTPRILNTLLPLVQEGARRKLKAGLQPYPRASVIS